MINDLANRKCKACEDKSIKPFDREEAEDYLAQTNGWTLREDAKMISKEYTFKDFVAAIDFVGLVADIAEMEEHHPDIHIHYNKVTLDLWTHAINGLSENDFIVAAKIDAHNRF